MWIRNPMMTTMEQLMIFLFLLPKRACERMLESDSKISFDWLAISTKLCIIRMPYWRWHLLTL